MPKSSRVQSRFQPLPDQLNTWQSNNLMYFELLNTLVFTDFRHAKPFLKYSVLKIWPISNLTKKWSLGRKQGFWPISTENSFRERKKFVEGLIGLGEACRKDCRHLRRKLGLKIEKLELNSRLPKISKKI